MPGVALRSRVLGIRLPIALVLFVVPAAGLATVAPLPGGLGGFEIVLGAILVALTGLELAIVAAIVLLYRLCSYWSMVFVVVATSAYSVTTPGTRDRTGGGGDRTGVLGAVRWRGRRAIRGSVERIRPGGVTRRVTRDTKSR